MPIHACTALLLLLFASCTNPASRSAGGQDTLKTGAAAAIGPYVEIIDGEALKLVDSDATVKMVDSGFAWTEGPLYIGDGNYFLFSDIPNNAIYKWSEGRPRTLYLKPSGNTGGPSPSKEPGSNALLLDPAGRLVLCQQGNRQMARMNAPLDHPAPQFISLATGFNGKKLNSPNDAAYRPGGDLYFTDPFYGLAGGVDDPAKELPFQGVFRADEKGTVRLVSKELKCPNGICFSPDGNALFIANSDPDNPVIRKYRLDGQGNATAATTFFQLSAAESKTEGGLDGIKMTRSGYLFAGCPGGVWVLNLAGKVIAKIHTGEITANCAFSADEKTLFMTCNHAVKVCRLKR